MDAFPPGEGHFGMVRRFPIGVISAITPFNFPLNLVAHKVAPCIATGNTMVVKPATKTPLTALLLAEVLVEAGMPAGQVNFVTCSNEDASLLVTDDRVKKVTFTGSPAVGWRLKEMCGKKRITLELGGNAGCIVHSDADLAAAVPTIALGRFRAGGAIVHQRAAGGGAGIDLRRLFATRLVAQIGEKMKAGDPSDRATVVGPMINSDALAKIQTRIEDAVSAGARVVCGGGVTGNCLEATVSKTLRPHVISARMKRSRQSSRCIATASSKRRSPS